MKILPILKGLPLCLLFLISCKEKGKGNLTNSLRDSVNIGFSQYQRVLTEYKDEPLTNDTILLGFRIGMPFNEAEDRILDLIEQNKIVAKDNSLFCFIPINEWCSDDRDSVHQFIAKLSFSFDDSQLTRIYAKLFAPRFYITPVKFRSNEEELLKNPTYQTYRKIAGDSFSFNQKRVDAPSSYKRLLQLLFDEQLLGLFKIKYGPERHVLYPDKESLKPQTTHIWIDGGRLINLSIDTGYTHIAEQYLFQNIRASKDDFSHLIPIGSLLYSSIPSEINFYQEVDVISKELGKQLDSFMRSNDNDREVQEKKRVEKIGI